jgi:hypothetical protein
MKKNDPFAALMTVAQDQQGYFTTKQAIEAGYADNTHPYHVHAGIGSECTGVSTGWRIFRRQRTGK